jgi:plasmid stabilization system protein ParE
MGKMPLGADDCHPAEPNDDRRYTICTLGDYQSGGTMPRGDKSKYTDKQKRQAEHIEEGYETRGVPEDEAERRAWATVNKVHGGGEKPGGSGYGKPENHEPMRKGGRKSHDSKSR